MREREKERATRRSFPHNNATLQCVLKRHWRIDREGESGDVCERKRKKRERAMRCSPSRNNAPLQRAVATRPKEALVHREKEREWECA